MTEILTFCSSSIMSAKAIEGMRDYRREYMRWKYNNDPMWRRKTQEYMRERSRQEQAILKSIKEKEWCARADDDGSTGPWLILTKARRQEIEERFRLANPGQEWAIPPVDVLRREPFNLPTLVSPSKSVGFYYRYMHRKLPTLEQLMSSQNISKTSSLKPPSSPLVEDPQGRDSSPLDASPPHPVLGTTTPTGDGDSVASAQGPEVEGPKVPPATSLRPAGPSTSDRVPSPDPPRRRRPQNRRDQPEKPVGQFRPRIRRIDPETGERLIEFVADNGYVGNITITLPPPHLSSFDDDDDLSPEWYPKMRDFRVA